MSSSLPFGGLHIVLSGDFAQLAPTNGTALAHAALCSTHLWHRPVQMRPEDIEGGTLLINFQYRPLLQQFRAAQDPEHVEAIMGLHSPIFDKFT